MESQGTRQDQSKPSVDVISAPVVATAVATKQPPTSMSTSKKDDREEDSGLHDIRSLASSTKARLSSRRSTQSPTVSEDDVLASSSAGWKAVALPEPAKMVSLPELAELPSAVEIAKNDKAARAEAKAAASAAKAEAKRAKSEQPVVADAPAVSTAPAITPIGSRIAAKQSGGKGKTIAIVGTLVAAAAGVAIFLVVNNKNDASHSASVADTAPKKETVMPTLAAPPAPKAEPIVEPVPEPQVAVAEPAPVEEEAAKPAAKTEKKEKVHKVEIKDDRPAPKEAPKVEKKEEVKAAPKEGDPDFDQLLREAGVSDQKKNDKPKLDKKDLSGGDFKNGMNAVSGKARACYQGTQGTAKFKVAISPEGKVTSVMMKGDFAGKPEGACVEAAVKGASFPAWDGAPKSFDYSYLLSD